MTNNLWEDFESVSAKQWKQKIQVDLKGADYNDTLVWASLEGINIKPVYHQEDFPNGFRTIPGHPINWNISQKIFIDDEAIANRLTIEAIEKGAEAIFFISEKTFNPSIVLKDFPFEKATLYFQFTFLSGGFFTTLHNFLKTAKASVIYMIDIIDNLARCGNWFKNLQEDHKTLEQIVNLNSSFPILSVDSSLYQNAGATCTQQLAYSLAHANEYLNHFSSSISSTIKKSFSITFNVSIGPNYFFEIAKIRALRVLYATLAKEYGVSINCNITATPSKRNKTLYDYNVNMLRTTTECMSAILGGANSISNLAYDAIYHKSNEFGERIARNQLLILKKESYFDLVSNPSDGSYYIESLTNSLAENALQLFKGIEANGGFLAQLKEGTIQRKIKESAQKEQRLFDEGKLQLVGTNHHTNPEDQMKNDLELYPFVKTHHRKTSIEPIIEKRLSQTLEKERLENEN